MVISFSPLTVSLWRSSDLAPVWDLEQLIAAAPETALGNAMRDLKTKYGQAGLKAMIALTDGQNNQGEEADSVAAGLGIPVHTIGLGSTESSWEVAIDEVVIPEQAFQGEAVPVRVVFFQKGASNSRQAPVSIQVFVNGQLHDEGSVTITPEDLRYEWTTEKIFESPGRAHDSRGGA